MLFLINSLAKKIGWTLSTLCLHAWKNNYSWTKIKVAKFAQFHVKSPSFPNIVMNAKLLQFESERVDWKLPHFQCWNDDAINSFFIKHHLLHTAVLHSISNLPFFYHQAFNSANGEVNCKGDYLQFTPTNVFITLSLSLSLSRKEAHSYIFCGLKFFAWWSTKVLSKQKKIQSYLSAIESYFCSMH